MSKTKIVTFFLLIAMLVVAAVPASNALAATGSATIGSGTITGITIDTDPDTHLSTVVVTLLDSDGLAQTVRVSLETAVTLTLILPDINMLDQSVTVVDETVDSPVSITGVLTALAFVTAGDPPVTTMALTVKDVDLVDHLLSISLEQAISLGLVAINEDLINTEIVIDPTVILESGTYGKIVTTLGSFFGSLGVGFDTLQAYKDGGTGFGVIAQALWMTSSLGGDAATFDEIMAAKASGDFSGIVLPEGQVVTNWGALRKALLTSGKSNLGQVMSGKADPLVTATGTETTTTTTSSSKENGNGKVNTNGKSGEEHGKGVNNGKKP